MLDTAICYNAVIFLRGAIIMFNDVIERVKSRPTEKLALGGLFFTLLSILIVWWAYNTGLAVGQAIAWIMGS